MNIADFYIVAQGLAGLKDTIINNWIGPLFIGAIAVYGLSFLRQRQWMQVISFIGIAVVVAIFVYGGDSFFGKNGSLKKSGEDVAHQVNVVSAPVVPGAANVTH